MTPDEVQKQLNEVLPSLIAAKEKLAVIDENKTALVEIKTAVDELKTTIEEKEKQIEDLGKELKETNKTRLMIASKSFDAPTDMKRDMAKFFFTIAKNHRMPDAVNAKTLQEIHARYDSKGLTEGTITAGGYGVPDMFIGMIWRELEQQSLVLQKATTIPLTPGYKLPIIAKNAGTAVAWEDEQAAFNESSPTWTKSTTDAKKLAAYVLISNELLEDEEFDPALTDYLIQQYAEAMGTEIDNQGFNGTGSPFTGVLSTVGVNTVTMDSGDGAFGDINFDYMSNMLAQIKTASTKGAEFFMHRTIIDKLRQLQSTSGGYLWKPASAGDPAQVHGYNLVSAEEMPTLSETAVSTAFSFFANMKNYVVGAKGDMTVQIGKELKMLTDQTVLAVRKRIALVTALPNAFCILKTNASTS